MELDFVRGSALFKALADETRSKIVHILSCGEVCACELLDYFDLSQPTLSHHLGILVDSGLVRARPEGKWTRYSLNRDEFTVL
ncbi:MAG TPA: metalloregulator ArsR/SmtB family transcription factor, partial [Treponemataceae bacterium]|nr:metalloregulator ArsR/SmtB family transcription factor [Treponemataceae bacterium]